MGNLPSRQDNSPSPSTGLTPTEEQVVRTTWLKIREGYMENGVYLFMEFFAKYPEYKSLFKDFANEPTDTLSKNPRLSAHALAVFYHLTAVVETLDDPKVLEALIRKNAISHTRRKGLTPTHFANLMIVMRAVFEKKLGPKVMTATAVTGWDKVFRLVQSIVNETFEEAAVTKRSKRHSLA